MPLVGVLMGSESDRPLMQATVEVLEQLGVASELNVISAHRQPEKLRAYVSDAQGRGVEVFVAGAGMAAHLPGVVASMTTLPVIGVPLPTSDLQGFDALLAIVQMPPGVPVATVAVGKAGARNAAFLAAQILALKHDDVREAFAAHKRRLAEQ